jgi:hypothetical protein
MWDKSANEENIHSLLKRKEMEARVELEIWKEKLRSK